MSKIPQKSKQPMAVASFADSAELADIFSAINQLKDSEVSDDSAGTSKLTKQERRNLNKKNKLSGALASSLPALKASAISASNESVYKRETVYPPPMPDFEGPWDRFLTPVDDAYDSVVNTCYKGLHVVSPDQFDAKFHSEFDAALEGLDVGGFYQYDVTQPQGLGTKTAKTFVTRCLLGEAGTTYKYLGIRMFSVPWNDSSECDPTLTTPHAVQIGKLNKKLVDCTNKLLAKEGKEKVGSCQYNLTLVNR